MLSHRTSSNEHDSLPVEISELSEKIATLPEEYRTVLQPGLKRVVEMTKRRRRILSLVQEALGQLRLDMKYLMFDLDATRRERDQYGIPAVAPTTTGFKHFDGILATAADQKDRNHRPLGIIN